MEKRYCAVAKIFNLQKGKPPTKAQSLIGAELPYLTPEYLRGNGSAELFSPNVSSIIIKKDDLILLWDGSNAGEFFKGKPGILASTMVLLNPKDDDFLKEYLFYALKIHEPYLKNQTSGSGIPHVDKEIFGRLEILKFNVNEQSKIAGILFTIDQAIKQTEALIAKQQRIKAGLMQDFFTKGIDEHGNIRSEGTHEFKDSPLGRIPVEWGICHLEKCVPENAPICYGILMPGEFFPNGIPVIKVKDIMHGQILFKDILLTDPKIDIRYSRSRLKTGDLLLTIRGTTGRVASVPDLLDGANITQDTARIRVKNNFLNDFIYFYLQSTFAQKQISLNTIGQAVKGINISDVKKILVLIPEKHEQKDTAKRLNQIESLFRLYQHNYNKLLLIKNGLMQDLLTGRVRVASLLNQNDKIIAGVA